MHNMDENDDPERFQNLKNLVYARLIETGEIERLRYYVRQKLGAIGWKNDMMKELKAVVNERKGSNITVQSLYDEISVRGRKIDPRTRNAMLMTVRHSCNKVLRVRDDVEVDKVSEVLTTERRGRSHYINQHRN